MIIETTIVNIRKMIATKEIQKKRKQNNGAENMCKSENNDTNISNNPDKDFTRNNDNRNNESSNKNNNKYKSNH